MEGIFLVLLVYAFLELGAGAADDDTLLFRPVPDAAEQAYVSRAFALGKNPLLPIVNELHPSRFSPVHPLLMSLWIRLNAGKFDRIFQWSPLAILFGMLLLYILLVKSGAALPVRLMSAYLILIYAASFVHFGQNPPGIHHVPSLCRRVHYVVHGNASLQNP